MKETILKKIVEMVCDDYIGVLLVGIEEYEKDALEYIELLRKQYKFAVFDFYNLEDYYSNPLLFKIIKVNPKCVAEKKKVFGLFLLESSNLIKGVLECNNELI